MIGVSRRRPPEMNIPLRYRRRYLAALLSAAAWGALCGPSLAQSVRDAPGSSYQEELIRSVGLDQKPGAQIPLDLPFRDEDGRVVRLGDYCGRTPVLLTLIQYRCTMLCSEVVNALLRSLREVRFDAGNQFSVIVVSIDPREQPSLAQEYGQSCLRAYGRPGAGRGWHCLTGDEASIRRLARAIGYRFAYDARTDRFAHPDAVVVLTPAGRVARYFFQLEYPARDLRWALVEAAAGKIGSPLDALALLCYRYDPATGKYSLALLRALRVAGLGFLLLLGSWIAVLRWRERRRNDGPGSPAA